MNQSERRRKQELESSKEIARRFLVQAKRIKEIMDTCWEDLTPEEYLILQNECALFENLAQARQGTR